MNKKEIIAYVDGSYNERLNLYGSGIVLIDSESVKTINFADSKPIGLKMQSTAGELVATIIAIKIAIENEYEKVKIIHDYSGIKELLNEDIDSKKRYIVIYQRYLDFVKDEIEIEFVKVKSHSGNEYNNMADRLAKKACLLKY